jgi:hypothetical protein
VPYFSKKKKRKVLAALCLSSENIQHVENTQDWQKNSACTWELSSSRLSCDLASSTPAWLRKKQGNNFQGTLPGDERTIHIKEENRKYE